MLNTYFYLFSNFFFPMGVSILINIYFTKENNPLRDSGNRTSNYTSAISFSFPFPLSLNLGWGLSSNSPNDLRQSETVITVYSTKLGYKLLDNNLNVTLGGNYVVGIKR